MMPLKLTMSAFGPYVEKTVIDFTELGESGIYLITGDTGAGKTTIFDAISYALFGDASGDERDAKMLRSKYAEPEDATYVELEFKYNGKKYVVKRSPEYERMALRGGGMTKQTATVEFTRPNGAPLSKTNEANDYIEELLGVSREQFAQIAMIAQGEFRKLLNADTRDRQEIFRKLFKTDNYQILQQRLKTEANDLYRQYMNEKQSIEQYISEIQIPDDEDEIVDFSEMPVSEVLEKLSEMCDEDDQELKEINKGIAEVEKALKEATKIIEKDKEAREVEDKIEICVSNKEFYVAEYAELSDELAAAPSENEMNKNLREAEKMKEQVESFTEIEKLEKEVAELAAKLNVIVEEKKKNTEVAKEKSESLKVFRDEYQQGENLTDEKDELNKKRSELVVIRSSIERILNCADERDKNLLTIERMRKEYAEIRDDYNVAVKEYNAKMQLFFDEQAGVIAERLEDGKPCPVCGSEEHPKIAVKPSEVPTESELNLLEKEKDKIQAAMIEKSERAGALKTKIETYEKDANSEAKNIFEKVPSKIEDLFEKTKNEKEKNQNEIAELEKKIGEVEGKIRKRKELAEEISKTESAIEKIKEAAQKLDAEEKDLTIEQKSKESVTKEKKARLKSTDKNKLLTEIEKCEKRAEEIKTIRNELDLKIKQNRERSAQNAGLFSSLLERQKKLPRPIENADELAEKIEEATNLIDEETQVVEEITFRLRRNRELNKNIAAGLEKFAEIEEQHKIVRSLSDTANGTLTGKEKVMLEIYVQTTFFDRIVQRANTRFFKMTSGHFELKRAESALNKTSQSGLDLNVIDHYNGAERSVKTLSGGESFMASLSLALGLSDEIQVSAGGIQLKTMFIDEGFGSLDAATLSQALDALSELADPEGGKLVGIISHVGELKNRIDKQIVVAKDMSGRSSAKVVV